MTIITKPLPEKRLDSFDLPLVEETTANDSRIDVDNPDAADNHVFIIHSRGRRVSTSTLFCVFVTALLVTSIGVMGGLYVYRQYARAQMHRFWCSIPYERTSGFKALDAHFRPYSLLPQDFYGMHDPDVEFINEEYLKSDGSFPSIPNFFKERFEIEDGYEKIDVPDFKEGRRGIFIHDFHTNITGIIDAEGKRCFVMPLDREAVLPPSSLRDLMHKLWEGYYDIDMATVKNTMRAVLPAIDNFSNIGIYITKECQDLNTYFLEKQENKVTKRSADMPDNAKFAQFAGKMIEEFDIVNYEAILDFEEKNKKN